MSRISELMSERRISYLEAERIAKQEAQGSLAQAPGSAAPPCSSQMMRDLCASLRENGWNFAADTIERQEADIELMKTNQTALQRALAQNAGTQQRRDNP